MYQLRFKTRFDLTSTFLRFEEYYESPEFAGKHFTLAEFKKWYMKSQNKKRFTYYEDWSGFNIPSKYLKPFYDGKFDPLTKGEKQVLEMLKGIKGRFYLIGTFIGSREKEVVEHETVHAIFSLNKEYQAKVRQYLKDKDCKEIRKQLLKMGYCEKVLVDETNAYLITDAKWLKKKKIAQSKQYRQYSKDLIKIYKGIKL